jgi:hypothetical protein
MAHAAHTISINQMAMEFARTAGFPSIPSDPGAALMTPAKQFVGCCAVSHPTQPSKKLPMHAVA